MKHRMWKTIAGSLLLVMGGNNLYAQDGFDLDDLKLGTAQDLVEVCTVQTTNQHYEAVMAFCYGFFEGATHYHNAISASDLHADLVCEPDGVTRSEAVNAVIAYLKANPQYGAEPPIDAVFRALMNTWPCPE
ncbi:MAG: hypothetical protein HRT77_07175 [Halioglobus sp.]|nr:hypothetical protein [Halioglobus sp.]